MDSDMLHKEMEIPSMVQYIWYIKLNITHQLQHITYQFTHNISETRHITCKVFCYCRWIWAWCIHFCMQDE